MLEKWKKAVIHLECLNSDKVQDIDKEAENAKKKLEEDRISQEGYSKEIKRIFGFEKNHGTALFVNHNSKNYLVTARHVIFDKESAKKKIEEEMDALKSIEEAKSPKERQFIKDEERDIKEFYCDNIIFDRIFHELRK